MKEQIVICSLMTFLAVGALARQPNYDESRVMPYTVEDPLVFTNGSVVKTTMDWLVRRAEILDMFANEMFGREPPVPEVVVTERIEEGHTLGGLGVRRQIRMWFKNDRTGPYLDWLVILPNRIASTEPEMSDGRVLVESSEPVPALLFLNFYGNHELLTDKTVVVPGNIWLRNNYEHGVEDHRIVRPVRGAMRLTEGRSAFPIEIILARGYAVISACYGQVSPDVDVQKGDVESQAYSKGVFELWPRRDESSDANVTAIGAWAWALSRGLDLAERIPEIDSARCVATGCSRLGKTALLAAARDARFAVCAPVQTGGGGCPLAKRDFGENVSTEMRMFPHWFCKAYAKYIDNEQKMNFDQHLLLAAIAPRPLIVLGFNSPWFDTKGEYLACRAASAVWSFLGKKGLPPGGFPANYDTSQIGQSLGYVRRGGAHGISGSDWKWILDFADGALK